MRLSAMRLSLAHYPSPPTQHQVHVTHSDVSGRTSLQKKMPLARVDAFFADDGTPTLTVSVRDCLPERNSQD